ncbi:hypothetical protein [Planosporangium mesophilum]|uniref:Uncharacterized protein n=1 Tax=Planosporangium mesophilum TaxID=689768 RepID=A0A8J3TG38_9ACTN|nr:hypothetical protein [Planosporangium mesophilum]NJC86808.1 hypothetical protein [Planosporangium mesophilum]GII26515.1 hypothetical protein Pme01_61120 [Planosporangium mesophilum]
MDRDDADRYPYRDRDLERVRPSELRVGDLVAHAGPAGSRMYCGDPVTFVAWAGFDPTWNCDTYRVEYRARWGEGYFVNPDRMHVYRVKTASEA